jgi:hypothetical protein
MNTVKFITLLSVIIYAIVTHYLGLSHIQSINYALYIITLFEIIRMLIEHQLETKSRIKIRYLVDTLLVFDATSMIEAIVNINKGYTNLLVLVIFFAFLLLARFIVMKYSPDKNI